MKDTTTYYLTTIGAVILTLAGMQGLISGPAERRAGQRFERLEIRLDKVDSRLNEVDSRLNNLEQSMNEGFREVNGRFDGLEKTLDERVDKLETDLAITTRRLDWEQEQKPEQTCNPVGAEQRHTGFLS